MLEEKELNSIYCALSDIHTRWVKNVLAGDEKASNCCRIEYFGLLEYLMSTGWDEGLPLDMEPDDEYLPQSYIDLRNSF